MDAIDAIQQSPQFAGLKKEVIEIAGRENIAPRKILVIEQCGLTEAQRGRVETELKSNKDEYSFIMPAEGFGLSRLYIDLASVSFGNVPDFLEFVAMSLPATTAWMEAAVRVNPVMFEWLTKLSNAIEEIDKELQKAEEEKKSVTPPMSENG